MAFFFEPEERRLVWLRAERVRWKLICGRFGVGRTKAWEMYRRALASAERKMPEQIIAHDITKLKQAYMKLREMADILGIETQALDI